MKFNPLFAAIVTLTINASAYLAEIFRGGIQAVDRGQVEAAELSSQSSRMRLRLSISDLQRDRSTYALKGFDR